MTATTSLDLAHLQPWVGRSETTTDTITAPLLHAFRGRAEWA